MFGFVLLRRLNLSQAREVIRWDRLSLMIISILIGAMGVLNLLSGIFPSIKEQLRWSQEISPLFLHKGESITEVISGFALLVLALHLWRCKRVAWVITLSVLVITTLSGLKGEPHLPYVIFCIVIAVWLWLSRSYFYVRSDDDLLRMGVKSLGIVFSITMALGVASLYMLNWANYTAFDIWAAIHQTIVMFTQFYDPGYQSLSNLQRLFSTTIYTVGALSFGFSLIMSLRPVRMNHGVTPAEHKLAQDIIMVHGRNSMAGLALLPDKVYYFSPGGSVIAYTVRGGMAVVMGDPIGPPEDIVPAISGFRSNCKEYDWRPVFCLTGPEFLENYRREKYRYFCLGHEAVVDLQRFTLAGRASKSFRKRFNRLTEIGYRFILYPPPVSDEIITKLRFISDEWLSIAFGSEKRFFLGWFDEDYIRNTRIAAVQAPDGEIQAFVNVLSEYQLNEVTIDLFRHRKGMKSGAMDFLFVSLFLWARDQGYDTFNLGLSALYGVGNQPGDPWGEKIIHKIYTTRNSFYDFKGLQGFKSKFQPFWQPQYFVYPGLFNLPRSLISMVQANAGSEDSFWEYFKPKLKAKPRQLSVEMEADESDLAGAMAE